MSSCFLRHFNHRRCLLFKQKIKIKRLLRVSSSITNRMQKKSDSYLLKTIETTINTGLPMIPFLKRINELYIINEIILFLLFRDDFNKIRDKKYQMELVICILDIFFNRIVIPYLVHITIHYFFHNQNN